MSDAGYTEGKTVAVPMTATFKMLARMAQHLAAMGVLRDDLRADVVAAHLQGTWAEAIYASPEGGRAIDRETGR